MRREAVIAAVEKHESDEAVWDREYAQIHGIPSSTRPLASKALVFCEPYLNLAPTSRVLDAGCGNGRNAVHLAKSTRAVVAVDFSREALGAAVLAAQEAGCSQSIEFVRADMHAPLPFADQSFDVCLDSYVSCHFVNPIKFRHYWSELVRITKPHGTIFSSMFSVDDEYYSHLVNLGQDVRCVTDPVNGITKRLYTELEFLALFPRSLSVLFCEKFQFSDRVLGREYRRSLLLACLKKRA